MNKKRRLIFLLTIFCGLLTLALYSRPDSPSTASSIQQKSDIARLSHKIQKPIPTVHKLHAQVDPPDTSSVHPRNLFIYTDVPPPPLVPPSPPPPPPPPPPEIKPEARFVGTANEGSLVALFSFKGDIYTLREGDLLEQKYIVKKIDSDNVTLEDRTYHNTAIITAGRK